MDATQMISDSILESDEEENEEESENKRGQPLAKLCILKNEHIPETEFPLFLGDNVLGRDPNVCTLPLPAPSVSKQHATICVSVYKKRGCRNDVEIEALVWDLGSMNGTRKGRLKLTPNVRYALSECDSLVVADIPCQFVSCAVDGASSQGDTRTPASRTSGVKARFPNVSREKGDGTSTGSKKCVNGGAKSKVSSPDSEATSKTPVGTSCLSFEQTPTQPQGTLVPESDSDSDGERRRVGERRQKALVSDSGSCKSSPTCSTFLSPANKIVPESEDESPITPSSTKNRPQRHVSFTKEETDVDVGRQRLKEKKALVIADDSEEDEGGEEERAALGGGKSEESGQHVPAKQEGDVSFTGEAELPVSAPAAFTNAIPAFNMDSDTDVEGEEEGVASAGAVTLNTNQQAAQPPNSAQFHMDSDTDVDEEEDALDKVAKSVPSSADNNKAPHVISVIQPEGITMDSDTDVDDDDDAPAAAVSDAATKAKPVSFQNTARTDSAPSTDLKDLHVDSDTDVDEEEEKQRETNNTCSKIDETPIRLDIKQIGPESVPVAPHSLHLDSDTDDEAAPAPATSEPSAVSAVTESCTTADVGADLDTLSDSDKDVDEDSPLVIPIVIKSLSACPGTTFEGVESDSDADTDVDESTVPPAGGRVSPVDPAVDRNIDVENKEVGFGEAGEDQIPDVHRENTPGLLVPPLQKCSTPLQLSEGEVEHMETQTFLSPSSGAFRRASALGPRALSSCSDSQEDEDFVVAETQSFILQTRDCQGNPTGDHTMDSTQAFCPDEKAEQSSREGSFQLGLSDSSHLQDQAQALAMESTQAFVSADGGVHLEHTQAYGAISNANRPSLENDSNLEATQAYEKEEEGARCSVSEKEDQVDLALEPTQAYFSEPCSDSNEDERGNTAPDTDTEPLDCPTSYTLAMAETQPVSVFAEDENLEKEIPVSSLLQVKPRQPHKTEVREEHGEPVQPQQRQHSEAMSVAETQPMCASDNEESDEEDSIPGPRKRRAKALQLEEEQTQPLTISEVSAVETQPMCASDNEGSDEEDSIPGPRKREAKPLQFEDEQTQPITSELSLSETQPLHMSVDETQPMATSGNEESDDEDSFPGPRKRKAKPLQSQEEESQQLSNAVLPADETQPMNACEDEQSDEEDSIPGPRKRRAKALQLEEEQTQPLIISEVSAVESQPMDTGDDGESDDEDSVPGPRKRRARPLQIQEEDTQSLTNSEAYADEAKTGLSQRGKASQSEAGSSGITAGGKIRTRSTLREEEEQPECSDPPKRQTRWKNKALPTTRGRRGKSRPDEDESEEEVVEQAKRARGKKSTRQQKHEEEAEERLETERQKLVKEQEKLERERKEKEEQERLQAENEERLRLEQERAEKEQIEKDRREQEEKERLEREQAEKEDRERIEKERKEQEEKERLEREQAAIKEKEKSEREEKERIERERKEQEDKERADRAQKEKEEQLERERKKEKERLERENAEREERERTEKERQEREEKERLEAAKRELDERLERERKEQEREEKEREERERSEREKQEKEAREKQIKEQQENKEEENKPQAPARGRRAARRTTADPRAARLDQESTIPADEDVPRRITRSRSNSSNSVSSERSASSSNTQRSQGRGRGRGAKRTSETPQVVSARSSNRRRTVAAGLTEQNCKDISPQGALSRSSSTSSLNSEISTNSLNSQSGGRGGRQRGRGRKTEADSVPPVNIQSHQNSAPKPATRGRKSRKAEESLNDIPPEDNQEKVDSQQATTTRGRRRAGVIASEPVAADEKDHSNVEEGRNNEGSLLPKRNARGRNQKADKSEAAEAAAAPADSNGGAEEKRKGRKRESEANTEEDSSCSSKISKGSEKTQATDETKDEIPVQANRRGRPSSAPAKNVKDSSSEVEVREESETKEEEEEESTDRRGRRRPSVVQKKKKAEKEESATSVDQDANVETSEFQTPTSSVTRKRQAPVDSSPVAKTPRSSSASPVASGRLRAATQAYKVLFTGVVDEAGQRVLARLGGSMAKGAGDMNVLVTDKVRRTVKFLCAVAKGVPIVTTHWLEKSGKAGSFLSPNAFVVKDPEQEQKFNFCLQESLRIASSQPLLQGYEIHVTKSVKPEPVQMKDIISCSGATFLPKMPSSHKPHTVVVSCEEDWTLCRAALSASLPVVTAEFILTGILQQKVDFQTHVLSGPASNVPPAGGRGRARKKS